MILVIGAGVAGLSCALGVADAGGEVTLIRPDSAYGSTRLAQGGIASAIATGDSPAAHLADTVAAGHGLVDAVAARQLVEDGVQAVRALIRAGMPVDRDTAGHPLLGLEAAHGRPRIIHCGGDRSGAVLHDHLLAQIDDGITVREGVSADSLLLRGGRVTGVRLTDGTTLSATAVVLATGGYAALYPSSSNDPTTRGQGIALAARAGAVIADMEFVQFHPTVIDAPTPGHRGYLVSEAVRGAGAVLLDSSGHRFMSDHDPRAELAPRDVVSASIDAVLRERGDAHVFLDATRVPDLATRFPQITSATRALGLDWTVDAIPVAPAAHYTMGGVATDLDGRTSVPGLFAVGEVASTGVHGSNRLASNSLLEGLVFGRRAGRAACGTWTYRGAALPELIRTADTLTVSPQLTTDERAISSAIGEHLGIVRDASGIASAARTCSFHKGNSALVGTLIAAAAAARTESRGAHRRSDHPGTDPKQARRTALTVKEITAC
ncbi:L-aspartate oxidase [Corynebacterium pacaense]|uniref:L-aspartate oxidase n=1 Tax=Corynebacterium pacaense TaxID=1816684 RepID=UPI0009BB6C2F|nr:FAD-dependent oxidoreductase [Corynebacterium pacaense]